MLGFEGGSWRTSLRPKSKRRSVSSGRGVGGVEVSIVCCGVSKGRTFSSASAAEFANVTHRLTASGSLPPRTRISGLDSVARHGPLSFSGTEYRQSKPPARGQRIQFTCPHTVAPCLRGGQVHSRLST
jgi:hypothetical protein